MVVTAATFRQRECKKILHSVLFLGAWILCSMRRREHTLQRQLWVGVPQKGMAFLVNFIMVTLVQSFMEIHAYQPFRTN